MANPPLSHVTTRRLTKPWECAQRQLYYYDFTLDSFGEETSRTLLTADESFGEEVEVFLNRTVETPLAGYLDEIGDGTLVNDLSWKHERALVLSLLFQPIRVGAARGDEWATNALRDLLTKEDSYFDQLVAGSRQRSRHVAGKVARGQMLFFPADGLAGVPLAGAASSSPSMLFQPTTLTTFFAAVPRDIPEHVVMDQLRGSLANGMIVAYSVGLKSDRVIVPPPIRENVAEANVRTMVRTLRDGAVGIAKAITRANEIVGL
jgi:hypothetical protein